MKDEPDFELDELYGNLRSRPKPVVEGVRDRAIV